MKRTEKTTFAQGFWMVWIILSFIAFLCVIPAGVLTFKTNPNAIEHSKDAILIAAHPYSQSTGKYSSEIRWKGRFQLDDGRTIDQNIDGFFYNSFIKGGEKPIKSWVSVTGRQLWIPDPTWVEWRAGFWWAGLFGWLFLLFGFLCGASIKH